MQMKKTLEERMEQVNDFTPMDDVFFEALARSKEVCEEILRTLMGDANLVVEDVITQSSERNLYGRSVRLDALCVLSDGTRVNIEVQRTNNDNHLKRARFNASSITVLESNPGDKFDDVLELYIIYISEFDIFKMGKTIYHIDKVIRETGEIVDDGLHEIFVNTEVNDGTDIAALMSCFVKRRVQDPKFPVLSNQVEYLKCTEGGLESMSKVMDRYMEPIIADVKKEVTQKVTKEVTKEVTKSVTKSVREETICSLVKDGLLSKEDAAVRLEITVEEMQDLLNSVEGK